MFRMGTDYFKALYVYEKSGLPESLVTLTDPNKHQFYRRILNPVFSVQTTEFATYSILFTIQKATDFMKCQGQQGKYINMTRVYRSIMVGCHFLIALLLFLLLTMMHSLCLC